MISLDAKMNRYLAILQPTDLLRASNFCHGLGFHVLPDFLKKYNSSGSLIEIIDNGLPKGFSGQEKYAEEIRLFIFVREFSRF